MDLLYHRLRMAKEVQAHMWTPFLERVVRLAGGRMTAALTSRLSGSRCRRHHLERSDPIGLPPGSGGGWRSDAKAVELRPRRTRQCLPRTGWTTTTSPALPDDPPDPLATGSWRIARTLMSGYEFADPSIVRAYYDARVPLERRNMPLRLQALGVAHLFVGVRVGEVYEQTRELGNKRARVWAGTIGRSRDTWRSARWTGRCGSGSTTDAWNSAFTPSRAART